MRKRERGGVTLPVEDGLGDELYRIIDTLGADAVRDSDGTTLPDAVADLGLRVYGTYFPARGDQAWAEAHPGARPQIFLMSPRTPAHGDGPLVIPIMRDYLPEQIVPDTACDTATYWQVIDRTSGATLPRESWAIEGEGGDTTVRVSEARAGHVYTATFLAYQNWDPTQMYNYVTNGWEGDPLRLKEIPYDVRSDEAWTRARERFARWLETHPHVDTVRFTTFFYHFTLVFNRSRREQFVDWFGYGASVSVDAIRAFEAETGRVVTPEDFVADGTYCTPFSPPSPFFAEWIAFQTRFVRARVSALVEMARAAGRETIMFLGDNWIGTEPYAPGFAETGLGGVVGSVGSAATCRMIAEIPGVTVHEGRLLPYFFPDVFNPEGDPLGEADACWAAARRAIMRKPLERIGYGGYLSLAAAQPGFIERAQAICEEFRQLRDALGDEPARTLPLRVAVLTCWGGLRAWQTHMVAHAVPYPFTAPYVGVLEALAGLPLDVSFISFDDVRAGRLDGVEVVINAGAPGDAFSGGRAWSDPTIEAAVRAFVMRGGGIVGVGAPSARADGRLALADVFGVDLETGRTLSTDRYAQHAPEHWIAGGGAALDLPDPRLTPVAAEPDVALVAGTPADVRVAAAERGDGRAVYLSGLPYTPGRARLLLRAIAWAGQAEGTLAEAGLAADPAVDVSYLAGAGRVIVANSGRTAVDTAVEVGAHVLRVQLAAGECRFLDLPGRNT